MDCYNIGNTNIVCASRHHLRTLIILKNAAGELIQRKEKQKYHAVGTVPKSTRKIVERCKIDIPNTKLHSHSRFWFGKYTSR